MKFNTTTKAILYMIISSILFTTMNLFGKLSLDLSIHQKAFISNFIALIIISIIILKNKISFIGKRENFKYLSTRGICGALSLISLYYTLDKMILCDSTLLSKLSPFFATVFGLLILKNKITRTEIFLLFLTLVGAILVIKPSLSFKILPSLIGILGAAAAGLAFTMIRLIGDKENKFTVIFYNVFTITLISFPFIFYNKGNYNNSLSLVYCVLSGLCVTFAQLFLTLAYKNAPASKIAMYDYIGLIVSSFYSILIFKEFPDILSIIGYILIIIVAVINFIINHK